MTWSQMEYFSRAVAWLETDRALLELAIAHNPYAKTNQIDRLGRELRRRMRSQETGDEFVPMDSRRGGRVGMTGESLQRVASIFGPVKRVTLSPEEFQKRMHARVPA